MARFFEKISYEQFTKDICDDKELYQGYNLPKRSTKNSAGYDFFAITNLVLHKGESIKIPTGVKVGMDDDEVLLIVVRSSMGFKYNIRMCNQVGVIDSDYYNNMNNEGDAICQGIFVKYLTVDYEQTNENIRTGGIGSTNRGD